MSNLRIIFSYQDNSVGIIIPAPNYVKILMDKGMSEIEAVTFIQNKDLPPEALRPEIINVSLIPAEFRYRRDYWRRPAFGLPKFEHVPLL